MSQWKKVPEKHVELLAETMRVFPDADLRKMFGCPAYFVNGNMMTGAHQDDFILRLSAADQQEILNTSAAVHFIPREGMVMKEYVLLPPSIYNDPEKFHYWLRRSEEYVRSLPPKEKKQKIKK